MLVLPEVNGFSSACALPAKFYVGSGQAGYLSEVTEVCAQPGAPELTDTDALMPRGKNALAQMALLSPPQSVSKKRWPLSTVG